MSWTPHKSNRRLLTHSQVRCEGTHCPVHNPSNHHMKDWPQNYRDDLGCTERVCEHGIGHPDPDDIMWESTVHGCDGCCTPPAEPQVSLLRRVSRWLRCVLSEERDGENGDQFLEILGENETLVLELEHLQLVADLQDHAIHLHKEIITDQKKMINLLKVQAGITKRRGRPRKQ